MSEICSLHIPHIILSTITLCVAWRMHMCFPCSWQAIKIEQRMLRKNKKPSNHSMRTFIKSGAGLSDASVVKEILALHDQIPGH